MRSNSSEVKFFCKRRDSSHQIIVAERDSSLVNKNADFNGVKSLTGVMPSRK